jgi:hypothetical protein
MHNIKTTYTYYILRGFEVKFYLAQVCGKMSEVAPPGAFIVTFYNLVRAYLLMFL